MNQNDPYLSIVTISRNDDHGGDPLRRTQIFIDSYAYQAEYYKLETELILLDWNPPLSNPRLADALSFPANNFFCTRVIIVPIEVHEGFRFSEALPLFQFIGKNAGIRRAKGEFILSTCMDTLLDDRLFEYISKRNLNKNWVYRSDLYDIKNDIPDTGHIEQQTFCQNPKNENVNRLMHQKYRLAWESDRIHTKDIEHCKKKFTWADIIDDEGILVGILNNSDEYYFNFEACGDFTLMHKDAWSSLRGHGEFESYSMHIDSQLLAHAVFHGFKEANFLPPLSCYHIQHGFQRGLDSNTVTITEHLKKTAKANIPVFWAGAPFDGGNAPISALITFHKQNPDIIINDERWGLNGIDLEEIIFNQNGKKTLEVKPVQISFKPLSAIKQAFYFETFTFDAIKEQLEEDPILINTSIVIKEIKKHNIIWFFFRIFYQICLNIYRFLKAIKRKFFRKHQ